MEPLCLWVYLCCILLSLMQCPTGFPLTNNNNKTSMINHVCCQEESRLLLQLKQQLPPYDPLSHYPTEYWNGSRDCCQWDGVTCDNITGHVIALDLSYSTLSGELKSNSSLFHLTHLRSLNFAHTSIQGLPSEFGRLNALTHLDLSLTRSGGELPSEFYALSNLLYLDLSMDGPFGGSTRCDINMLFANMTRLRVLRLAYQDLSDSELPMNMSSFLTQLDLTFTGLRGNLPATIFEKPDLQILYLSRNPGLNGSLPKSLNSSNVRSIKELELSDTSISGRLPDSIGFMTNLNTMRLSNCSFSGPIPESIVNITAITLMDLSFNDFSGRPLSTISNLRHLDILDLSFNHLEGQLPDPISGFQSISQLVLSNNHFEGRIPSYLTNMSELFILDISSNALSGPFPTRAGPRLQHLYKMKLDKNYIQGMIPPWLFTLSSLGELYLSSNRLNIELQSFSNLSGLESLFISHNTVTEHGAGDIVNVTFPYLTTLEMSSCEIKEFPNFLRSNMPNLETLDLSNNSIHGQIPSWFTSNSFPSLEYLNLSYNSLTYAGDLPGLQQLDLHSNSLRGTFPSSICNKTSLFILNLSHNKLSGTIPECLFASFSLKILDLRMNEFQGKIPAAIGGLHVLANIGLSGNQLEGPLPQSLANCTGLEVIDLGYNTIQDTFPWWLHTLPELKILILKSNSFHGSITSTSFTNNSFNNLQIFDLSYNNLTGLLPRKLFATLEAIKHHSQASPDYTYGLYMGAPHGEALDDVVRYVYSVTLSVKGEDVELTKVLEIFTTIDLSSNNFNGSIPDSLSNLTSLRLLNLSHNNIHDSIPPALGRMTNLEQLDLSSNQLTGGIPQTLTNLTFLGAFDVSHNYLVGPIPQGNQFLTFSNESYVGNSGLCGAPLTKSCGNEREPPSVGEFEEEEDEEGFMMGFTWKVVVMGYGCGTLLGFILGSVMLSMEKPKWLARFVYVEAAIILSKRNKRRRVVQRRR